MSYQIIPNKIRSYYVDTIGGILIIRVILWHCFQWANLSSLIEPVMTWLGFTMLWYFYKGGMFFKGRPLSETWKKCWKRLMIPYIVFSIIGIILYSILTTVSTQYNYSLSYSLYYQFRSFILSGSFYGNLPLWFFIALIASRILFTIIHQLMTNKQLCIKLLGGFLYAGCFIIPIMLLDVSPYIPKWISYILMATAFFGLGHFLKNVKINATLISISLIAYIGFMLIKPTWVDMFTMNVKCGSIYLWYPQSLIAIIAINGIGLKLFNNENIFAKLGRNTLPLFCLHWPIIIFMSIIITMAEISSYSYLSLLIIGNCILLPLLISFIRNSKYRSLIE